MTEINYLISGTHGDFDLGFNTDYKRKYPKQQNFVPKSTCSIPSSKSFDKIPRKTDRSKKSTYDPNQFRPYIPQKDSQQTQQTQQTQQSSRSQPPQQTQQRNQNQDDKREHEIGEKKSPKFGDHPRSGAPNPANRGGGGGRGGSNGGRIPRSRSHGANLTVGIKKQPPR